MLDRIEGALVGAVLGDAFGAPLEGISRQDGERRARSRFEEDVPWSFTDDSVMLLAVATSLVAKRAVDPPDLLRTLSDLYEPARGFGRGLKLAVHAWCRGVAWEECAYAAWSEGSRGNGGAVRVPPIACAMDPSKAGLLEAARLSCRATHAHPDAVVGAELQALAVSHLLEGGLPSTLLDRLRNLRETGSVWVKRKLDLVQHHLDAASGFEVVAHDLGTSALAEDSVPSALWCFLSGASSLQRTLEGAASLGGDVDSIGCLAGALSGSHLGVASFPAHLLGRLCHEKPGLDAIRRLAEGLEELRTAS